MRRAWELISAAALEMWGVVTGLKFTFNVAQMYKKKGFGLQSIGPISIDQNRYEFHCVMTSGEVISILNSSSVQDMNHYLLFRTFVRSISS